jgi:hypothetical protein
MTVINHEDGDFFLSAEITQRLRTILANGLVAFNSDVKEVLDDLGLSIPLSTASRAFSRECTERIRRDHAERYLHWLSNQSGISQESLEKWIQHDRTDDIRILRLAASEIFPHTAAGLAAFSQRADRLVNAAKDCWALVETATASFLPRPVRQVLSKAQTAGFATPLRAFRTEDDFARKRFAGVHDRHTRRQTVAHCVLSRVGVDATMKSFRLDEQRDALVETLLDRVEIGYTKVGFVDDRPGWPGSGLRPVFADFDIRAVVDSTFSIRRNRRSLQRYIFDARESHAQAAVVAEDSSIIHQAMSAAAFDFSELEEWLLGWASEDCWRKRRKKLDESWPDDI